MHKQQQNIKNMDPTSNYVQFCINKMNCKVIKDLNVKAKIINLFLWIGANICDLVLGKDFLNGTYYRNIVYIIKNRLSFIKIINFCFSKDYYKNTMSGHWLWEKVWKTYPT